MKMNLLWMYYDLMDLYGDVGNVQTLKYRCEKRNIECVIDQKTINDNVDFNDYDLVFIGGGADKEQRIINEDLMKRKENIIDAINNKTFFLLICGGYQFFGKYYLDASGNMIEGLGIYDYYTEAGKNRCIGNLVVEVNIDGHDFTCVGFENHAGQTKGVSKPLGKVKYGNGNEYQGLYEGFFDECVLGTYMHGPLLPKNNELADFVIKRALEKRNLSINLEPLDDVFEEQAKQCILRKVFKN